jgi:molecular chaperone GrpE
VRALEAEADTVDDLLGGVEMTLKEFDRVMDDEGVDEIAPEPGNDVDPQRHEVMIRTESEHPDGTIAELYQPGYEMADKVLRSARVTVSEGTPDDVDEETDAEADDAGEATGTGDEDEGTGAGDDGAGEEPDAGDAPGASTDDADGAPAGNDEPADDAGDADEPTPPGSDRESAGDEGDDEDDGIW